MNKAQLVEYILSVQQELTYDDYPDVYLPIGKPGGLRIKHQIRRSYVELMRLRKDVLYMVCMKHSVRQSMREMSGGLPRK